MRKHNESLAGSPKPRVAHAPRSPTVAARYHEPRAVRPGAVGRAGNPGLGRETTYGTAVSPTLFLIPSTEGYDGTNELLERPGARKRIGQTEQLTGMFTGKGSMQVEADPDTLGAILLLAMGAENIAADASNPDALAVSTTVSQAQGIGAGWMTPAAMTNIVKGQSLTIDTSGQAETVVVRAITATQFFAYFSKTHAMSVAIVNASVVLAYDHTFTLYSPRYSFTAQLNDVISAKNAFGAKIAKLSFKITPKAIVEAMCTVEYQGEANVGSPTSPTFSTLHGFVFTTPGNGITMNEIPIDSSVQGITLDIDIGLAIARSCPKWSRRQRWVWTSRSRRRRCWISSGARPGRLRRRAMCCRRPSLSPSIR